MNGGSRILLYLVLGLLPLLPLDAGAGVFDSRSFGLEVVWKKSLGSGHSRISVVQGRAITMFSDGEFDNLVALDAATGQEIWLYRIAETYRGHDASKDGPHATPIVDESVVYGLGPKGHLFAVSFADGKEIWSKKIDEELGARAPYWGFATTPVVEGGMLVVQTGGPDGRSISGFNKETGEILWSLGDDRVGYQSPAALTLAGQRQVVTVGNKDLMGILPETGEVLWKHRHSTAELDGSSEPVLVGDDKFLLTPSFTEYQSDAVLYQVERAEDGFAVEEIWRTSALKYSYAVPVLYEEHLYGFNRGFLTCVDLTTGKVVWKSRPPGGSGLILVDEHLVIFASSGVVVVAEATPEGYREKARIPISDRGSFSSPSFAEGRIYVRNHTHIASIAVTQAAGVAAPTADEPESAFVTSEFGAFVRKVQAVRDKKALMDEFMNSHEQFPVIEGDRLVHFVYRGEVKDIAIVGSMTDSPHPMERIAGTDFYYRSYSLEPNARWNYLFNINFEEFITDPLNPRRSRGEWEIVSEVAMPDWVHPKHIDEPTGERGRIESFNFKSEIRGNEREVKVYLPPGYAEGEERYPLLIVNNGDRALEYGKMDHSLDNLIGKSVAPIIVAFVGLPIGRESWQESGGPESLQEYGGPLTGRNAQMLAEELVPHLDDKYRTISRPDARAIMGNGSGGLAALYAALHHPRVFGKVAVQSLRLGPTPLQSSSLLHRPVGDEVLALVGGREKQPVQFYVDWTRYELRSTEWGIDLRKDSREFADLLKQRGYTVAGGESPDGAGWASWRARTDEILEAFFPFKAER
ncbi:MAG: PQQ-binding-like beta-propeller repeat protein [Acidobacteriota bacterium]